MIRKKIMCLCLTMIVGSSFGVLGESISKSEALSEKNIVVKDNSISLKEEQAKEISKKILKESFNINIDDEYRGYSYFNEREEQGNKVETWQVTWNKNTFNNSERYSVAFDAYTGKLLNASIRKGNDKGAISLLSYEESKEIAEKFLEEINEEHFEKCAGISSEWNGQSGNIDYVFRYVREENGIKFDKNYLEVKVDGTTGEVVGYSCKWYDSIAFPKAENLISKEKAEDIFEERTHMQLRYKEFQNKYEYEENNDEKNVRLVYEKDYSDNIQISAENGENTSWLKDKNYEEKKIDLEDKEEYLKGHKNVERKAESCSEDEAIAIAEEFLKDNYEETFELVDINYNSGNDEKTYSLDYEKQGGDEEEWKNVYVVIDAQSGQIIRSNMHYEYDYKEEFEPKLKWEEAYEEALFYIQKYQSDKLNNLKYDQVLKVYEEDDNEVREYRFSFPRVENGIVFEGNCINVNIDAKTGELSDLYLDWYYDVEFPNPENVLSNEDMKKKAISKHYANLNYEYGKVDEEKEIYEAVLVYDFVTTHSRSFNYYDAFDGKLLDNSGEEAIENIDEFKKEIENSKAKKELEILAYNGLIDPRGFDLDKKVTNMDLIKTLVDSLGYRRYVIEEDKESVSEESSDDSDTGYGENSSAIMSKGDYMEMAKYYDIIPESMNMNNPEEAVTREDLTVVIINMLEYDILAQGEGIFKTNFDDEKEISEGNLGYVAIAEGLGIIECDGDDLKPQEVIDYEEMCLSLYRTLLYKEPSERIIKPWEN